MSAAKLSKADQFFHKHAGYSWNPKKETQDEGRCRCAQNLAAAEALVREAGYSFQWQVDDMTDSSDFSNESPAWALYVCLMRDVRGKVVQALSAIDFGREASGPYGDYRRVVEAELASQEADAVLDSLAIEALQS